MFSTSPLSTVSDAELAIANYGNRQIINRHWQLNLAYFKKTVQPQKLIGEK